MLIRDLADHDRSWLRQLIAERWGFPVVSISGAHDPTEHPGLIAEEGGHRVGALTYCVAADGMEIVTLDSLTENRGVGSALLAEARKRADAAEIPLWLITTNDNIRAIRFHQRRGMDLGALYRDFVEAVRHAKPCIETSGTDGIVFRHALRFEYRR